MIADTFALNCSFEGYQHSGKNPPDVLQFALGAILFGLIARYTWPAAIHAFNVGEYATGIINFPLWPARFILAFGVTLMTVQCLFDMLGVGFASFRTTDIGTTKFSEED